VTATVDIPGYRTIPIRTLPWLSIHTGHDYLASALKQLLGETRGPARIVIDGFSGVQWGTFIGCLRTELTRQGVPARWISTEHCLWPPERVDDLVAPFLTADPVFGRLFRVPPSAVRSRSQSGKPAHRYRQNNLAHDQNSPVIHALQPDEGQRLPDRTTGGTIYGSELTGRRGTNSLQKACTVDARVAQGRRERV